ncbi:nuclear pore complex protein DDB_G0274915-like [Paramacrobiotus metropolitanus]|uniref:nuclear pore complex protein DDB_G0274915-like n=1 Tax=Paramacrobiotus metropolitanus TaxID=2943436 RepID=UPI0024456900|nr:nuclear pore complex protein DDB_G0274915-like [Paramacrobiotus metropolitanus]
MTLTPSVCMGIVLILQGATGSFGASQHLRTTNVDGAYGKWNASSIPFCIDLDYSATEKSTIQQAIQIMTDALSNKMVFTPVDCTDSRYKIRFTALTGGPGSANRTSSSSDPGVNRALQTTQTEQMIAIARDSLSCSTDVHCVLKFIAISLGKREEQLRKDRDLYITLNLSNAVTPSLFTVYTDSQAYWGRFGYDYCSITHNQPTDYAKPGTVVFTVPAGRPNSPGCIPKLNNISNTDCQLISMFYGLNPGLCLPLNCAAQSCVTTTTATTTTTPLTTTPTTTTASTTTGTSTDTTTLTTISTTTALTTTPTTDTITAVTCPTAATAPTTTVPPTCSVNFCATPTPTIDEASILWNDKYYMFSGDCAVQIDITNKIIGPSVPVSYVLPGVTGPVRSIWTDQKYQITRVRTDTAQYNCWASGCFPVSPMVDDTRIRWEFIRTDYTGAISTVRPYTTYSFDADISAYEPDDGGFLVSTSSLCVITNNCKITQGWNAAYMVKGAGSMNYVNVIGIGDDGNQYIESLFWADTDVYVFLTNGDLLSKSLQCPSP